MLRAKLGKEVVVKAKNDIGRLFKLSKLLSDKGMNILAVSGAVYGEDCVIRLITDDHLRTMETLAAANYAPHEENVVLVELSHKPGMLKRVTETLAKEGIDIHHVFATALDEHDRSLVVLHSSNDAHALVKMVEMEAKEHAAATV